MDEQKKPENLEIDNVLAFPISGNLLREGGGPVSRVPSLPTCMHREGVYLHNQDRKVTCKNCNAVLDPFDALGLIADKYDWTRGIAERDVLRREIGELEKIVKGLKGKRARALKGGYVRMDQLKPLVEQLRALQKRQPKASERGVMGIAVRWLETAFENLVRDHEPD